MDKILHDKIQTVKTNLAAKGVACTSEKAINYGYQLVCRKGGYDIKVNIYHGKKGLSVVIQGKDGNVKDEITAIAKGRGQEPTVTRKRTVIGAVGDALHPAGIDSWMGCDESGKGDVFGPLVGAACLIHADEEERLKKLGVCDSKLLTDSQIANIAKEIHGLLGDRCVVRVVLPDEYNKLYEMYRRKRQNLNHLLGNLHSGNIRCLLSKHECPCIIVDKFGKDEYVLRGLGEIAKTHRIIQVPKGERDTAVAAASIVARQGFVMAMRELEAYYGMDFPKGAYAGIGTTIRKFQRQYGNKSFIHVGKLNFKTFDFLREGYHE